MDSSLNSKRSKRVKLGEEHRRNTLLGTRIRGKSLAGKMANAKHGRKFRIFVWPNCKEPRRNLCVFCPIERREEDQEVVVTPPLCTAILWLLLN